MKKIKQLLGITMVFSAFAGLFIMTWYEHGAIEAIKVWLVAIGVVSLIWGGIYLMLGDDK